MTEQDRNVETCATCKFFRHDSCYRMPPVWTTYPADAQENSLEVSGFSRPYVNPDDFCGEWKRCKE